MSDYDRDVQKVVKRAQEQGWRHRITEKNHHQLYAPDGHTIVTTSGTPGDHRAFANFLSDMRRAGFQEGATTNLGEAIRAVAIPAAGAATATVVSLPSVPAATLEVLRSHPNGLAFEILMPKVKARVPKATAVNVRAALYYMKNKQKLVVNPERSFWRAAGLRPGSHQEGPGSQHGPHGPAAEVAALGAAPTHPAGASSGDAQIDADLKALDEALVALSKIEEVVRRNREILHIRAQLKKIL